MKKAYDTYDPTKHTNIHNGSPRKRRQTERDRKKYLKKIMAENFQNLTKDIKLYTQVQ